MSLLCRMAGALVLGALLCGPTIVRAQGMPAAAPTPAAGGAAEVVTTPAAQFDHRPMTAISLNINLPQGDLPQNRATPEVMQGLEAQASFPYADWLNLCYCWEAPAICYRPLLFEEENLERYGYTVPCPTVLQPVVSCGKFFLAVPMIPYNVGAHECHECIYDLGYERPGSCVPYRWHYPPLSVKGGLLEAAAVTGVMLAVP